MGSKKNGHTLTVTGGGGAIMAASLLTPPPHSSPAVLGDPSGHPLKGQDYHIHVKSVERQTTKQKNYFREIGRRAEMINGL